MPVPSRCRRVLALAVTVLATVLSFGAACAASGGAAGPYVLASTSWTAAIARAAGAAHVDVLAEFDLRHPPERDFRPSDVSRAAAADVVLWAGYEGFVRQLLAAAEIPAGRVVQIRTENTPAHLVAVTRELAALWGTQEAQATWEEEFLALTRRMEAAAAEKGTGSVRVVAVDRLASFVRWLGYDVVATFSFAELTPARLFELQQLRPDLVIDVWHNPTAEALAAAAGVPYILLLNFPGYAGTRSLADVFVYNARQLGLWED